MLQNTDINRLTKLEEDDDLPDRNVKYYIS